MRKKILEGIEFIKEYDKNKDKYLPLIDKYNIITEKAGFCKGKEYILVDDLDGNCDNWENAGGIAIRVKNIKDAFKQLYKIEEYEHMQDKYSSENQCIEIL